MINQGFPKSETLEFGVVSCDSVDGGSSGGQPGTVTISALLAVGHIRFRLMAMARTEHEILIEILNILKLVGGLVAINFIFPDILGMSSSQLTNSYFSEGFNPNHQPVRCFPWFSDRGWGMPMATEGP